MDRRSYDNGTHGTAKDAAVRVRAAVAHAFRAQGNNTRRSLAEEANDGSVHRPVSEWVCFPFAEWSYGPWDRAARAPPLAAALVHQSHWRRAVRAYLLPGAVHGWRAASRAGATVVHYLPTEHDDPVTPGSPFNLVDGIQLVDCLCAGKSASIYRALVTYPGPQTENSDGSNIAAPHIGERRTESVSRRPRSGLDDGDQKGCSPASKECVVVKLINARLSGDFDYGWAGTRRIVRHPTRLVCSPAWSEPVALSRTYPTHFYGAATFFCAADGDWYVCLVMPVYHSTLNTLMHEITERHLGVAGREWADTLLAALAQIVLHALPRAKRAHMVAHNDFKIDNVAYRHTSRRHIYVRLTCGDPRCRSCPVLAIPTNGCLFYMLDFGWASVACANARPISALLRTPIHANKHAHDNAAGSSDDGADGDKGGGGGDNNKDDDGGLPNERVNALSPAPKRPIVMGDGVLRSRSATALCLRSTHCRSDHRTTKSVHKWGRTGASALGAKFGSRCVSLERRYTVASATVRGSSLYIESSACMAFGGSRMRSWNPCTDAAQLAYSLASVVRRRLGCPIGACPYTHMGDTWWGLLDAMAALMAVGEPQQAAAAGTDGDDDDSVNGDDTANGGRALSGHVIGEGRKRDRPTPIVLQMDDGDDDGRVDSCRSLTPDGANGSLWNRLFYAGVSESCHMAHLDTFVRMAIDRYALAEGARIPDGRVVVEYIPDAMLGAPLLADNTRWHPL